MCFLVLNCTIISKCRGNFRDYKTCKIPWFHKEGWDDGCFIEKKHYRKFFDLLKTFFRYANNIQDGTVITTY